MGWRIILSKKAQKDGRKLAAANLEKKTQELLGIIEKNPFQNPPPYEKLVGGFRGAYSRRINGQHRLVYNILLEERAIFILQMWDHYE